MCEEHVIFSSLLYNEILKDCLSYVDICLNIKPEDTYENISVTIVIKQTSLNISSTKEHIY